METISLLGMIGLTTLEDLRKKQVDIILLSICGIAGVILHLIYHRLTVEDMAFGVLVGVALYVLSLITREMIGKGDGMVFMVTGIYLGGEANFLLLWLSLMLSGAAALAAVIIFKKKKSDTMPFVPFIALSLVILLIAGKGQIMV